MRRPATKNLTVLAVAFLLTGLGAYNIFLKATWTLMDDGVFWKDAPQGVVAGRVAAGGPADLARDPRRRRAAGDRRRGGADRRAGRGTPRHAARRRPDRLLAPAGRRAAFPRGHGAAASEGQRHALLLPLPGRLLQPGRRHHRDAAASARPRRRCTSTRSACSSS